MEDADLGDVARVVADGDRFADVLAEHGGVEVAQAEQVDAVGVDLARLGDGEQQQVQLLEAGRQVRQEPAGVPSGPAAADRSGRGAAGCTPRR